MTLRAPGPRFVEDLADHFALALDNWQIATSSSTRHTTWFHIQAEIHTGPPSLALFLTPLFDFDFVIDPSTLARPQRPFQN
jgi:hypothetical protein